MLLGVPYYAENTVLYLFITYYYLTFQCNYRIPNNEANIGPYFIVLDLKLMPALKIPPQNDPIVILGLFSDA